MEGSESRKISIVEKLIVFLLAICPILQHYKGPFFNAAVTVLIIVFPYTLIVLLKNRVLSLKKCAFVLPLIIYFAFKVIDHGTTINELGQAVIFTFIVIVVSNNYFNTDLFIKIVTTVSVIASICIIVQYICYYLFHFHIQMVPVSLLLDKSEQWVKGAQTGRAGITGKTTSFYRPSAFFLEPSHMFIYMLAPLFLNALSSDFTKKEKRIAILLSVGMVFSTSGMGILTAIGVWVIHFGRKTGKNGKTGRFSIANFFKPKTVVLILLLLVALVVAYFCVPFFQNSVARIFGTGSTYKNAIAGRVSKGNTYVSQLHGKSFLFGVSDGTGGVEGYMSGFNDNLYRYGIIGIILSYVFYVQCLMKLKGRFFWLALFVIITSFFSYHTHSTMFMIYITFVFVWGKRQIEEASEKALHNSDRSEEGNIQ